MNFLRPTILKSTSNRIDVNLALESYLFSNCVFTHPILFLWQNDKTIVIGRHQNPWKECNIQKMKENNVWLQRRKSGGGAVYHDLGNHCFTFLREMGDPDPKTINNQILLSALAELNIQANISGRNDIEVDGKKISGSAYQLSLGTKLNPKKLSLHHGTMMINVDTEGLSRYLTPTKKKLESKGIDSVRSRIQNLHQFDQRITVESYEQSLIKAFVKYNGDADILTFNKSQLLEIPEIAASQKQLSSDDWLYGQTPQFTVNIEERFAWGNIDLYLNVEDGVIKECKIYSDSLYPDFIDALTIAFIGKAYNFDGIKEICRQFENDFIRDVERWLLSII